MSKFKIELSKSIIVRNSQLRCQETVHIVSRNWCQEVSIQESLKILTFKTHLGKMVNEKMMYTLQIEKSFSRNLQKNMSGSTKRDKFFWING